MQQDNHFEPQKSVTTHETEIVESIQGFLKHIRFASDDGTFAVCELERSHEDGSIIIVGNILATRPGEHVEVQGQWQNDARFGRQFSIHHIKSTPPTTRRGIEGYLSSQLMAGVGPVLAKRIVNHFGRDTLAILDRNPERIREVDGIGTKRAESIMQAWAEQRLMRRSLIFLRSHAISERHAAKILEKYGEQAVQIIEENPYQLVDDIYGIGFRTADTIATHLSIDKESPARLRAGLLYCLKQAHNDGHMFLPMPELILQSCKLLDVSETLIRNAIEVLGGQNKVIIEPCPENRFAPAVYQMGAWRLEVQLARHLARLQRSPRQWDTSTLKANITELASTLRVALSSAQKEAVLTVFDHKTTVITGGPGTGKTTLTHAVCQLADFLNLTVALAAPTGRAARRLCETSGRQASTLHRLLEYSFQHKGFLYREDNPLNVDLLIIDEASMLDNFLLHAVVRALPDSASLLLVGDVDQLPSVGPGNVLRDVIESKTFGVVQLTEVFRQARQSSIVHNAHRINEGKMPVVPQRQGDDLVDFYTIHAKTPEQAQQRVCELVTERIPGAFGLDPLDDLQVITPMHKGAVGCEALNRLLQQKFHPHDDVLVRGHERWYVGDKVMQTRNNYEFDVFNGDIGRIEAIDHQLKRVTIRFDEKHVAYPLKSLDELTLAYAITIHKSQGSEYPGVIIPVVTQHTIMLQRNLLYTALTRARQLAIFVGTEDAVRIALRHAQAQSRHTRLRQRLQRVKVFPD